MVLCRLVLEGESGPMLYYCTNNSRVYREKDLEGMSIHPEVTNVINNYVLLLLD